MTLQQTLSNDHPSRHVLPLRGRGLRFVLLDELRRRETMAVADMVAVLDDHGYEVGGRASKIVSDALRWEVARGRVKRIARGIYRYARVPPTTARRIRLFAECCHAWIVAVMRNEVLPPTPSTHPDRRSHHGECPEDPARPPWDSLSWLWAL